MKYIISFFLILCLAIPKFALAQSNLKGSIKGQILDKQNEAISYATVSLFNNKQELVQGVISDENGNFTFEKLPLEILTLDIKFLGYHDFKKEIVLNKKTKKINLGVIKLEADHAQLEEVVVTAEKSTYNLRLDKKVFNVGKDVLSQGGSAIDVLDQVPLVSVDPSGTVLLRGNSAVQILINGKRSGLTLNNALDQIPSDNIDRVEVITNPSASFDASGSAGIINIVLKKNKEKGLSGQLRLITGAPANHIVLPGLNYKNKKVNLFSNFRWRYSDYNGTYKTAQRTFDNGTTNFLKQVEDEDRHDDGRSAYFGSDFYLNNKNTITAAYYRSATKDTDVTSLKYQLDNETEGKRNILRTGNSVENRNYNQVELNYTKTFDEKGKKFTTEFQYDFWNSNKDWDLSTSGDVPTDNFGQPLRTFNKAGSKDFVYKSDFQKPINENSKIEFGVKLENRIVDNDYQAEIFLDEKWDIFNEIDNDIKYTEKIGGAYIQYQNVWKSIEYMAGIRSEYTSVDIKDQEQIFNDQKSYINFFPSASASISIGEKNSLQASYSKRINRPSLWNLYPFFEITDFNFQETGNPNLNPAFADAFEIAILSRHDKLTINPGLYYRNTKAPFQDFVAQNDQGVFINKPINIDRDISIGGEVSINYQPFKALSFNTEFNWNHFERKGSFEGQNLDASGNTWHIRAISNLNILKGLRIQTRFDYWAPENQAQVKYLETYMLSFGLSKNVWKDKLTIGLRADNVLDSRAQRSITQSDTYYIERNSKRVGARFGLSLLYRFNQTSRDRMRQQNRGNR